MDKLEPPPKSLSKSLTRRIILLSLFGLAGLIATTILSLWVTLHRVEMNMDQVKIEAARNFDLFFLKSQSDLLATGEGLAAHQDDINSELLALRTRNNAFLDVLFVNVNGEIISQRNVAGRPKRTAIEESEWLNPEPPIGKVTISPVRFEGQSPYVDMAVTATDAIGLPAGFLIVRVDLTQLWNKTLDIQVGTTGYAYIVDETGQLVAFRNRWYLESGNTLQKLVGRSPQTLAGSGLNLYPSLNAQFVLAASQPMATVPWFAIVEQPVHEALAPFIPVGTILLLAIVIVGFLLNHVIQFTQTRIVSPLLSLQRVVSQMGSGQMEGRAEILFNDELGQLGRTFNQMADEILAQTESLCMAEADYRAIFEKAPVGIFRSTEEGRFLKINPAMAKMYGYGSPEEMIDQVTSIAEQVYVDRSARNEFQRLLAEYGEAQGFTVQNYRKDGSIFWISTSSRAVKDEAGQLLYYEGFIEDVTERKRAEEALQASEHSLATAQAMAKLGSWAWNPHTNIIVTASDELLRILNLSRKEVTLENFASIIHPDDLGWVMPYLELGAQGKNYDITHRLKLRDGTIKWIHTIGKPQLDDAGKVVVLYGTTQDITERKLAEERIEESEARYRLMAENVRDVIWVMDVETQRFTYVSLSSVKLRGYTPEEIMTQSLSEALTAESARQAGELLSYWISKFTADPSIPVSVTSELDQPCKDGSIVHTEVTATLAMNEKGKPEVIGVSRDITERKQAERVRVAAYKIAQAAVSTESLDDLYTAIHNILGELLPVENFYIALYDPGSNLVSFPYYVDQYNPRPPIARKYGHGLTEYVLRTGKPLLATHEVFSQLIEQGDVEFVGTMDSTDWLGIPLKVEGQIIGMIATQRYAETIQFSQHELELLEFVSTQAAQAIQRKRSEEALRESEQKFRAMIEQATEGFALVDEDGIVIEWNRAKEIIWGLSREQVLGRTFYDVQFQVVVPEQRTPERYAFLKSTLLDTLGTGQSPVFGRVIEAELCKPDGKRIFIEQRIFPVKTERGYRVASMSVEVTERKRAEETLREHQQMINAIVESSHDWIWTLDITGQHTYSNAAVEQILGYTPVEFQGMGLELLHPEDRRLVDAQWPGWVEARQGWSNMVLRWRTRDGDYRYLESTAVPFLGPQGELLGYHGVDRDITERKQAEEALRESEEQFRKVFEDGSIGMVLTSRDLKFFSANPAFCRMLGYTVEEMSRKTFLDVTHPAHCEADRVGVEKMWQGETPSYRTVKRYIAKNGDIRWGSVSSSLIRGANGEPLYALAMVEDITERKQAEAQLQEQLDELRRWHQVTIGREDRIIALKHEINELLEMAGKPPRYPNTSAE